MKKLISMLMVFAMLLTLFVGCKASETEETTTETTEEVTEEITEEVTEDAGTVNTDSLEGIIEAIYAANPVEFAPMTMPLDLTDTSVETLEWNQTYTGLASGELLSEAVVSEAMIGAIPFSMVLVRVADEANVQTVADGMKAGINQRKWVCVFADDLMVVAKGDIVMLVMIGSDYGTAQSFVDAFTTVMGEPDYIAQ